MVLHELGFENDVEIQMLNDRIAEHKTPEMLKLNPNGRLPILIDHKNNNFTLWESGAIVQYLVDKYDTEKKISFSEETDRYHAIQWLAFQISGQGPYYGQLGWFALYHHEKLPSAINRYAEEIHRIMSVLDGVLKSRPSGSLVGDKISYADISFVPWQNLMLYLNNEPLIERKLDNWEDEYPAVSKWVKTVMDRPAVKSARAVQKELGDIMAAKIAAAKAMEEKTD